MGPTMMVELFIRCLNLVILKGSISYGVKFHLILAPVPGHWELFIPFPINSNSLPPSGG